jgi:hypothetical protein
MIHACLYTISFVFCYTSWRFYAFSGTNLLTRCHRASSLFSAVFARLEFLCIFFTYDVYYNINYINRKCENSLRRFWASYLISRKNIIILMAYTYYLSPCTQIYFIQYLYPRKFSLLCRIYFTKVFLHKFILPSRLVVSNYLWCRKPNIMVLHFLIQFFNYSGSSGWLAYTCFQIKLSIFYIWPLYITINTDLLPPVVAMHVVAVIGLREHTLYTI